MVQPSGGGSYAGTVNKNKSSSPGIAVNTTKFTLEPWRVVNEFQTKIDEGSTWYWCPHH